MTMFFVQKKFAAGELVKSIRDGDLAGIDRTKQTLMTIQKKRK